MKEKRKAMSEKISKPESFTRLLMLIVFLLFAFTNCGEEESRSFDPVQHIEKYSDLLKKEPGNCLYLEQVAGGYQALNEHESAIKFYKNALRRCPDNAQTLFQLGACYYVIKDYETGLEYMDKAIIQSRKNGDEEFAEMYTKEKASWSELKHDTP